MGLRINTDISSLVAGNNISSIKSRISSVIESLSSPQKLDKAKDGASSDAAGMWVRGVLAADKAESKKVVDTQSAMQTADAATSQMGDILLRMRSLGLQAQGPKADLGAINKELEGLSAELKRTAETTTHNGKNLLDGSFKEELKTSGISKPESTAFTVSIGDVRTETLSKGKAVATTIASAEDAQAFLENISDAMETLSSVHNKIGASQNRLEDAGQKLAVEIENVSANDSAILNADMAQGMINFTRSSIVNQASTAVLAQANGAPQMVLQLLR